MSRHPLILGGLGSMALLGMVTASAIVSRTGDDAAEPMQAVLVLEKLALPAVEFVDSGVAEFVREERIQRSDTVASLFSRLGVNDPEALAFINRNPGARAAARQLRPGKTVTARTGPGGTLVALYFPISDRDSTFAVVKKDGEFTASEQAMRLSTRIRLGSGEIVSSLFGATDAAGIPDAVATQLAEIFSGDIDFYRDLRKGDEFTVIFESLVHNGQHIRSGRILAAEFVNGNRTHQAYWFRAKTGAGGYYGGDGKSLHKAFLRSPLEFSRVTSGFSNARLHPVLQTIRGHRGIDYGAPIGTRVRAVADGVVEFAGNQGGYGNLIVLRHQGRYSTAYGHLNGFAQGLHRGARVEQGDTIGFVGRTGLATGPHLHYEFRDNGQQINPLAVSLPAAPSLDGAELVRFGTSIASLRSHLDLAKQTQAARVASAE
ncbi:MAG: M23 family metallopeptidase [Candidatus Accumulibacter sp.]|nr:M23 family metallopeptidase [Accumulibacter sp.]